MGYKQQIKRNVQLGDIIEVGINGIVYSGEVIDLDFQTGNDFVVTLKEKDEDLGDRLHIIPLSPVCTVTTPFPTLKRENTSDLSGPHEPKGKKKK